MTKEEIAQHVATARASVVKGHVWLTGRIIAAMADENDRLRAERAEVIALLERWEYRHREPSKVASDTRSLLAKLKGQP